MPLQSTCPRCQSTMDFTQEFRADVLRHMDYEIRGHCVNIECGYRCGIHGIDQDHALRAMSDLISAERHRIVSERLVKYPRPKVTNIIPSDYGDF